jgi:DNA-binding response OmpR family regulator
MAQSARKPTVLIVDDDPDIVTLVSDLLEANGLQAMTARDGLEGILEGTEKTSPVDLVILDIMMPYAEGIGVLNALKAIEPDLPVIMLTAKTAPEDVAKGYEWGCDSYITKPFDPDFLLSEVRRLLPRAIAA